MAAASATRKAPARSRQGPDVNLFDMPEMMPGAAPSANPAQREEFEQRCKMLHRDDVNEERAHNANVRVNSGAAATCTELQEMFPMLDPELIRVLCADAPHPQHALETLLALSAAVAEPVSGGEGSAPLPDLPPLNLGFEDHEKFPSLTDQNGWQVGSSKLFEKDPEEDLGSAWRDRAKAAQDLPAPKASPSAPVLAKRRQKPKDDEDHGDEFLSAYEHRHTVGQRRARRRAMYGRGKGKGKGVGAPAEGEEGDGSESEASEDLEPV